MTPEEKEVIRAIEGRALTYADYNRAIADYDEATEMSHSAADCNTARNRMLEARTRWHVAGEECDRAIKAIEIRAIMVEESA